MNDDELADAVMMLGAAFAALIAVIGYLIWIELG